jgi:hypothetical protein
MPSNWGAQEVGQLVGRTKPHHPFDAGAVVPGAVEQHDATGGRQMRHVALEIPLSSLDLGRLAERHRLGASRIEVRHEALDGRALAGSVATFKQHEQALVALLQGGMQLDQCNLQQLELPLVGLLCELLMVGKPTAR